MENEADVPWVIVPVAFLLMGGLRMPFSMLFLEQVQSDAYLRAGAGGVLEGRGMHRLCVFLYRLMHYRSAFARKQDFDLLRACLIP